jgi:hypothetical protein
MTTIDNTKELPWVKLRAYTVSDEAEALQIAAGREAWLFKQTESAWYLFVRVNG